ncbi:MAG TPA: YihY/virulence factor BrkB family protein [Thermomicrobiales bacterium]|nr:YihY/virulence factor BrkB family protein [Thermomicrobiales bacterium]
MRTRGADRSARPTSSRAGAAWHARFPLPRALLARPRARALYRFARRYLIDRQAGDMAAAIAFHALLYLFPLLAAVLTIIGLVVQDTSRRSRATLTVVQVFPPESWRYLLDALQVARANTGLLGVIGAVGLFWFGTSLLASLARAFNRIYGVPPQSLLHQRLLAVALIVLVAALLTVTLVTSAVAAALIKLLGALPGVFPLGLRLAAGALALGTGLVTAFALFLALYWLIPNARQRFGDVWPGAAFATVFFVAATQLFPLYVGLTPANRYGATFGLVFLLTTWFYLLAHIILLGAAINAFRRERRATAVGAPAVPDGAAGAYPGE